jgi:hypothetical protein
MKAELLPAIQAIGVSLEAQHAREVAAEAERVLATELGGLGTGRCAECGKTISKNKMLCKACLDFFSPEPQS